jgi:hypothetical protein
VAKVDHYSPNNINGLIAKANYFYWLHNLPKSALLDQRTAKLAARARGRANARAPWGECSC